MKDAIWFLFIFVFSFCFYYTGSVGPSCMGIEKIGFTGSHVIIFMSLYYIACIYVFHIEYLKGSYKKGNLTFFSLLLAFLPILFPFLLFDVIKTDCHFDVELISFIFLLPLITFVLDRNGSIRKKIVEDFEARTNCNGGDLFFRYPPRSIDDIYKKIFIFVLLFVILITINLSF